ncbi:MAG: dockerin type I domain-containing protein [Planctomycetota bacterium]
MPHAWINRILSRKQLKAKRGGKQFRHLNPRQPTDVKSGETTNPVDALLVINSLSRSGSGPLSHIATTLLNYVDINGDGSLSPAEAVRMIHVLSSFVPERDRESFSPRLKP